MSRLPIFRWLGVSSLWCYRAVTWTVLVCGFLFALMVGGARFWLLPNIETYREVIARDLSAATKQRITIGKLEGRWSGFNLRLMLGDLEIFDPAGQPALKLERIDSTLSWWSVIHWEPRFDSIEIDRPGLSIRRDARGVISVAGIEVSANTDGGGLSDWLLRQGQIVIRDAEITWSDALRGAPELALKNVDFRMQNSGRRHRFGLRAVAPEQLATPLDVRGDLEGRTVTDLTQWNGQLFAQLDYIDIAAWRTWVDFPVAFPHGVGALRVWTNLKNGEPSEITADVQLAQVKTRLAKDLDALDLEALKGRVSYRQLSDGFEVTTTKLGMTTQGGLALQPVDLQLRITYRTDRRPARGELVANAIDIEPVRTLSYHLPFDAELRKKLEAYAPRGTVYDLAMKWTGGWPQPDQYSVKARFVNLGVNAVGLLPGFTGVSGQIDGSERGGTLYLHSQNTAAELPHVFRDKLAFDTLSAQVSWQRNGEQYEVRLGNVGFTNADIAGSVSGSYQTVANSHGVLDLTGSATRANAQGVGRYLPIQIGERGRAWLEQALLAGNSNDVKIRLKGDLDDFPFADGKSGIFQVNAHVTNGVLDYATGWPKIENIDADLTFQGKRMEILARSANILGTRLSQVRAELPDLATPNRLLTVGGDVDGPTSEFLKFIEQSPVVDTIDRFVEGVHAQGNGQLTLKLTIPISNTRETKVAGVYTFVNNQIHSDDMLFALEQVNGKLEFTENTVRVPASTMTILGGTATLNAATQRDGTTRVNMAGRINLENLRRSTNAPFVQALQGATDWKAAVTLRQRVADYTLESTLQGIASELPAPLAKAAMDSMPLRVERQVAAGSQAERFSFALGNVLSAQFQRRRDGTQYVIDRGTVSLGGNAAAPERNGVWVSGALRSLDLDQWLALWKSGPASGTQYQLAGLDVRFGTLDIFGRRFNDLSINGSAQAGNWQAVLAGRELAGEVGWRPQGKGKITARMKNLTIPAAVASRAPSGPAEKEDPLELPGFDVTAENFQLKDKALGKLELSAVPDGRDWRLERLRVVNPEATLNIEGLWQGWRTQPRTMVNVRLEVSDIGKALVRMGYPEGIRRGVAKLEGPLSWDGNPADLDVQTLSGNFVVEAAKGQFVKLDPGVGKLLGIMSLQALPRRLTLDFRDIFSDGLAFDQILGTVKVTRGVANTENFRIQGPAVRILMSGDVDLNAETQKLRVKVYPSMSDSLSVAGALIGGPIAGIASFLVQKVLKDPLDQFASYEYSITGSWADPQVVKVTGAQSQATEIK